MNIPIYNCLIDDMDDNTGIFAMSFVDCPANEADFVRLKKEETELHLNKDTKKQILTGVVLRPEQLIYRTSPKTGEYYIKFSARQIEKIAQKMMKTGLALSNTTHQHQVPLIGNYLTELWIIEDPESDKSKTLGFTNLPKGTLMCSYKIEDKEYWENEVMTGHVKGFSLEGLFNQEIVPGKTDYKFNKNRPNMNKKRLSLIDKLAMAMVSKLNITDVESTDKTGSGVSYTIFTLADGQEVYVDADGFATLDDQQMAAGEHNLADGNILVIDTEGQFVETKAEAEANEDTKQTTAPQSLRKKAPRQHFQKDENIEALKAKIAEMESIIDELEQKASDAITEAEELKNKTASTRPVVQKKNDNANKNTHSERMAEALSLTYQQRKKHN